MFIDTPEMDEQTKFEYQRYLDYMYEFEETHGRYPMELSNEQWTPYSENEFMEKTNNGNFTLRF